MEKPLCNVMYMNAAQHIKAALCGFLSLRHLAGIVLSLTCDMSKAARLLHDVLLTIYFLGPPVFHQ